MRLTKEQSEMDKLMTELSGLINNGFPGAMAFISKFAFLADTRGIQFDKAVVFAEFGRIVPDANAAFDSLATNKGHSVATLTKMETLGEKDLKILALGVCANVREAFDPDNNGPFAGFLHPIAGSFAEQYLRLSIGTLAS